MAGITDVSIFFLVDRLMVLLETVWEKEKKKREKGGREKREAIMLARKGSKVGRQKQRCMRWETRPSDIQAVSVVGNGPLPRLNPGHSGPAELSRAPWAGSSGEAVSVSGHGW